MNVDRTFKKLVFLVLLVFMMVLLPNVLSHVQAQTSTPTVRIEPQQTGALPVGDNFTVYVWVENAVGIEAAQAQFTYDPSIVNATQVVEGPFLPSVGSTIVAQLGTEVVSNALSKVVYSSAGISMQGGSGSGVLMNVTFTVLSAGSTTFHLVPFVPSGQYDGVYFIDLQNNNIIPNLAPDAYYGTPISLVTSKTQIIAGETLTFNGTISGSTTNVTSLELLYTEVGQGTWTPIASIAVDNSGSFTYQWTSKQPGLFAFQVSYVFDNSSQGSQVQEVIVQPALHGYSIYVTYVIVAVIVVLIAISIVVAIRDRRRRASDIPVL